MIIADTGMFIIILLTPGNGLDAGKKYPLSTNTTTRSRYFQTTKGRNKKDKRIENWNCLFSISFLIDNDYGKNIRVV